MIRREGCTESRDFPCCVYVKQGTRDLDRATLIKKDEKFIRAGIVGSARRETREKSFALTRPIRSIMKNIMGEAHGGDSFHRPSLPFRTWEVQESSHFHGGSESIIVKRKWAFDSPDLFESAPISVFFIPPGMNAITWKRWKPFTIRMLLIAKLQNSASNRARDKDRNEWNFWMRVTCVRWLIAPAGNARFQIRLTV